MMLKNERGAVHVVSLLLFVLALFGAWFLYKSYQQQRLQASVMEAANGYRQIIENTIQDPHDKDLAKHYLQGLQDILERNQTAVRKR